MKSYLNIAFFVLVFGGISKTVYAQELNPTESPFQRYAPLDSVPDWVKEKTTVGELALWQRLSQHFQVDYTVMLHDDLSEKQKKSLYYHIRKTCEEVENGTYKGPTKVKFSTMVNFSKSLLLHRWKVCQLSWMDEYNSFNSLKSLIFQSQEKKDDGLVLSISYTYDWKTKDFHLISFDAVPVLSDSRFEGSGCVKYDKIEKKVYGHYSGILHYRKNDDSYAEEIIETDYVLYPDRIEAFLPEKVGMMENTN